MRGRTAVKACYEEIIELTGPRGESLAPGVRTDGLGLDAWRRGTPFAPWSFSAPVLRSNRARRPADTALGLEATAGLAAPQQKRLHHLLGAAHAVGSKPGRWSLVVEARV